VTANANREFLATEVGNDRRGRYTCVHGVQVRRSAEPGQSGFSFFM
jgi:hypothetical protein